MARRELSSWKEPLEAVMPFSLWNTRWLLNGIVDMSTSGSSMMHEVGE